MYKNAKVKDSIFYMKFIFILSFLEIFFNPLYSFSFVFVDKRYHPINSYESNNYITTYIKQDFTSNINILKSYGPITLDINNINFNSNIYFVPALNDSNKPIFIAIKCSESVLNVWKPNNWKGWFKPFFNYEISILNDFCN